MQDQSPAVNCCAVILSGGLNSRMGGRNKAFLEVGGKSILDRLLDTLGSIFKEILLVTRQPELYARWPIKLVQDIYQARSSLTGIHAGLKHARAPFALVVPCDAPFLKPALIRALLAEIEPEIDAIVPTFEDHYEPLCAVYSKRCIQPIEDHLNRGDFKIINMFDSINLKTIPAQKLRQVDEEMVSFFNVNTPAALRASQNLIEDEE